MSTYTERLSFKDQCQKVAERYDLGEVLFFEDTYQLPFEDDGFLHIIKGKTRAVFDVSSCQHDSGAVQNKKTRDVLTALGLTRCIGDRVLVEEFDD